MTENDNIIVPRWFLEVVENTLQIQNDINLDKETGETCQDRNIRQSLNEIRKLLNGEELTGMERLEKLQPSLPSNLDEAAKEYAKTTSVKVWGEINPREDLDSYMARANYRTGLLDGLKAGAEWLMEQRVSLSHLIAWYIQSVDAHEPIWTEEHLKELIKDYILIPKD